MLGLKLTQVDKSLYRDFLKVKLLMNSYFTDQMPSSNKADEIYNDMSLYLAKIYPSCNNEIMNGSIKLWCIALANKIRLERIERFRNHTITDTITYRGS